jgi:hypothetical protein
LNKISKDGEKIEMNTFKAFKDTALGKNNVVLKSLVDSGYLDIIKLLDFNFSLL